MPAKAGKYPVKQSPGPIRLHLQKAVGEEFEKADSTATPEEIEKSSLRLPCFSGNYRLKQ